MNPNHRGTTACAVFLAGWVLFAAGICRAITLAPGDLIVSNGDFVDGYASLIRVDPVTGAQEVVTSGGLVDAPTGVAIDSNGQILVIDVANGIVRVDPGTGSQSVVSQGGLLVDPFDLAIDASGDLLVRDGASGVVRVDPVTGVQALVSPSPGFGIGIALEADGDIILSVAGYDPPPPLPSVVRIDPVTGVASTITSNNLILSPWDVAVGTNADIFVTDDIAEAVFRVDPVTGAQALVTSFFGEVDQDVLSIAVDADGDLLVVLQGLITPTGNEDAIFRIDPLTGERTPVSQGGLLTNLDGLAIVSLPEPSTALLFALGLAAIRGRRRAGR